MDISLALPNMLILMLCLREELFVVKLILGLRQIILEGYSLIYFKFTIQHQLQIRHRLSFSLEDGASYMSFFFKVILVLH